MFFLVCGGTIQLSVIVVVVVVVIVARRVEATHPMESVFSGRVVCFPGLIGTRVIFVQIQIQVIILVAIHALVSRIVLAAAE
jgi:hypothetical protein